MKLAGLLLLCATACSNAADVASSDQAHVSPPMSTAGADSCAYKGGCDGDIHPTSGNVKVGDKDCEVDGAGATMHMDPNGPDGENPGWFLESDSACGAIAIAGAHFEDFPQSGAIAWGNKPRFKLGDDAATIAKLTSGPIDHTPKAIHGTATVDGRAATFSFYFGDEAE